MWTSQRAERKQDPDYASGVWTDLSWSLPHLGHLVPVPRQLSVKLADLDLDRAYTGISLVTGSQRRARSVYCTKLVGLEREGKLAERSRALTEAIASVNVGFGVDFEFPNSRFIAKSRCARD